MKKKIYIGCSLTHAIPEFRNQIEEFKDSLREEVEVLDFLWVDDDRLYTPKKIYEHNLDCVDQCDVFVAECSYPSTGLGYEIALAVQKNKKILLIAHQDSKVTRMILGIPPEKAVFLRYQNLDEVRTYIYQNY